MVAHSSLFQGLGFRMCRAREFGFGIQDSGVGVGDTRSDRELGLVVCDLGVGIRGCKSREQFERSGVNTVGLESLTSSN